MRCCDPLIGYRSYKVNPDTGKRPLVFSPSKGFSDLPVLVPCNKCPACLMRRAFYWSVRCQCESYYHNENWFVTLTYNKKNLPDGRNLCRAHVQSFVKLLRYYLSQMGDYKIKVFYCGEYGEKRHRPHYHMIIFGLPLHAENINYFYVDKSKRGNINYGCPFLDMIWKKGRVRLGTFTRQSANYVAQYTFGKTKNRDWEVNTGKVRSFVGASNRTSLGYQFFMDFHTDIYRRGFFSLPSEDGSKPLIIRHLPYFDKLLEKHFKIEWFKYVELPRRAFQANVIIRTYENRLSGHFTDIFALKDIFLDYDSVEMYNWLNRFLRKNRIRDDF